MGPNSRKSAFVILVVIAALAGCAGKKVQTAAPMSSGGSMITIEAGSRKFSPNEIQVKKPGLLAVEIKNVAGSERNFTLKDPRGKVLKSINIRPGGSVIFNVELLDSGAYEFQSRKTLQSSFGMKGRIVVGR